MDLSHQSITGQQFELNRRGYDPDSVDAHLAQIAAAVAEREAQMAELQRTVTSLEAKVQDADESEEALRLTLKAAAHAKEELLAGAREQAEQTQREADEKAARLVSEAEERAQAITAEVEAKAEAMSAGATAQARNVAKAALAESELLVARIEELRSQVAIAEDALRELHGDANPRLASAREALDSALQHAKETAETPELLAAIEPDPVEPESFDSAEIIEPAAVEEPGDETVETDAQPAVGAEQLPPAMPPAPPVPPAPPMPEAHVADVVQAAQEAPVMSPTNDMPATAEPVVAEESTVDEAPHLEVVESGELQPEADPAQPEESTADISDKVDRLLEELREVT